MSDAKLKLQARKDSVDITKIALQGGVYAGFTTIDVRSLEDAVVRYGVAQALMDGLASTEEGLAVRDILPDLDFSLPQDVAKITTLQMVLKPCKQGVDSAGFRTVEWYECLGL